VDDAVISQIERGVMEAFRNPLEYPFFDCYWKLVSSMEQDKEVNLDHFCSHQNKFGPVNYITCTTITVTSFGNLFLTQYLPLDDLTEEVFNQLKSGAGFSVARFAP